MIDQFSFQRVHVHVVKFFDSLLQTPYIEIVETALPKARQRIVATCKDQIQLSAKPPFFATQAARDPLFENLNYSRRCSFSRFADEQMDMLRHDDVTDEGEAVTIADFAKHMDENIPCSNRTQKRPAPIASERNEMQMAAPVVANEFVSHGEEKSKPRPFKPERVGHPERLNQFLRVDVLEWYHPTVGARQQKKNERVGHPPTGGGGNPATPTPHPVFGVMFPLLQLQGQGRDCLGELHSCWKKVKELTDPYLDPHWFTQCVKGCQDSTPPWHWPGCIGDCAVTAAARMVGGALARSEGNAICMVNFYLCAKGLN
jgi:hypothetical protein